MTFSREISSIGGAMFAEPNRWLLNMTDVLHSVSTLEGATTLIQLLSPGLTDCFLRSVIIRSIDWKLQSESITAYSRSYGDGSRSIGSTIIGA